MKICLNDEIVEPLIEELRKSSEEEQREVIVLLDIEANLKLLTKLNEILKKQMDNDIKRLAILMYKISLRRINNMMKNSKLACSKEEKKHIDELYSSILENKPKKNNKTKEKKLLKI